MRIINKILMLSVAFISAGCVNDTGNYDYTTEPDAITISLNMSRNPNDQTKAPFVFKQGEKISIEAEYTINDPMLSEDLIAYRWLLGGEVVCTGKVFELEAQPAASYYGMLEVIDTRYNQVYGSDFGFQVDPSYTDGLVLLSDNGSEARLCYLYKDANTGEFGFEEDIYATSNNGAKLATGAGPLIYHPYNDGNEYGLTIIQDGEDGPVDVNAHDMIPYAKIRDTFLGGNASSLKFKDIIYNEATGTAYALTTDGQLYIRDEVTYNNSIIPQAGRFSAPYVSEDGCQVQHLINNSLMSSQFMYVSRIFGYDVKNHRCFYMNYGTMFPFTEEFYNEEEKNRIKPGDPGFDGTNTIPELSFPGPENLEGYEVKKMIGCGYNAGAWVDEMFGGDPAFDIIVMLLQNAESRNYLFAYDFRRTEERSRDVALRLFCEWPVEIDPETIIMPNHLGGANGFFFTGKGNMDIYYYDLDYGSCRKVYTSEDTVTAMRRAETGDGMGIFAEAPGVYAGVFVVGTENGTVNVLKMDDTALAMGVTETLYTAKTDGKITAIEYMSNNMLSY